MVHVARQQPLCGTMVFLAPFTVRREYCDLSENRLPFNRFPQIFIDKFSKEVI